MAASAIIFGTSGRSLTDEERAFYREANPWGFILFGRNVRNPAQLSALTADLRETMGRNVPILIDQEGGRVQRLGAPHWPEYLPALTQMARARQPMRAQWLRNRLIAHDLHGVGIDVNCAPLGDLVEPGTHRVLLNRLYGSDVRVVTEAAKTAAEALLDGGVLPVMKHMPGHGRAAVDSHLDLPRVSASAEALAARDFAPFYGLRHLKMAMSAHVVYEAIDPDNPATVSPAMLRVIREQIGFGGLIMTDDISMEALSGSVDQRCSGALAAGCDLILHSNGIMSDMVAAMTAVGEMTQAAQRRGLAALDQRLSPSMIDTKALRVELVELLRPVE